MSEGFGGLLGEGSSVRQFLIWGVAFEVARVLMGPFEDLTQQKVYGRNPIVVTTPAQLADEVVRTIVTEDQGAAEARLSGVDAERFHRMVLDTGEPPGLEWGLEAYRRDIIPLGDGTPGEATLRWLIRSSRIRPEWEDALIKSRIVPLPPSVLVDAVVEGQITYDQGAALAYYSGVSEPDFLIMVHTRGNPPSPVELLEMERRGIIPLEGVGPDVTSVQQGIYEGATKDKWWTKLAALRFIVPPPRTITALEREGALTPQQAAAYYRQAGLDDTLAGIYASAAASGRTSAHRQLGETQILQLYSDQLIPRDQAEGLLVALGYPKEEADLVLEEHDHQLGLRQLTQATNRVRSLYTLRKITRASAINALKTLGVGEGQITSLLDTWDLEQAADVKDLTPGEIADALEYGILTQGQAQTKLEQLGYTPEDAWIRLSIKMKGALPDRPPATTATPGPVV